MPTPNTDELNPERIAAALRAELSPDDLTGRERAIYDARLDDIIDNGSAEDSAFWRALRAEGGWGADDDGTLIEYDGEGNVIQMIEPTPDVAS